MHASPPLLPCPHCGLAIPPGTFHEGHEACLEAIEQAMTLAGRTGDAIAILRRYGNVREAAGEVNGRLKALHEIAVDYQRNTES